MYRLFQLPLLLCLFGIVLPLAGQAQTRGNTQVTTHPEPTVAPNAAVQAFSSQLDDALTTEDPEALESLMLSEAAYLELVTSMGQNTPENRQTFQDKQAEAAARLQDLQGAVTSITLGEVRQREGIAGQEFLVPDYQITTGLGPEVLQLVLVNVQGEMKILMLDQ